MKKQGNFVKSILYTGTLCSMLVRAPIISSGALPFQEPQYSTTSIEDVFSSKVTPTPMPVETIESKISSQLPSLQIGDVVHKNGIDYIYRGTQEALVTAYCPCTICCEDDANGRTSLGDDANVFDGVAIAPNGPIGYRDLVRIPGVSSLKEADDTGGAMRQSLKGGIVHMDLRMTHKDAIKWGRQTLNVEMYDRKLPEFVVIGSGDTLSKISNEYGVSVNALRAANNNVDPRLLKANQKIYFPKQN